MTTIECRSLVEPVEFRSDGTKLIAAGVAMRYGAKSKPIRGQFREQFKPGSLARTIKAQDVRAHNEHDGPYLARVGSGSLRLIDSRTELAYEIDLPDTTAGRDAAALLERGDIKGSSIGFRAIPTQVKWTVGDDGMALRTVGEAALFRVDLTTSPAYDDSTAEIALRSLADERGMELRSVIEAAENGHLADVVQGDTVPPVDADAGDAHQKIAEYARSLGVLDLAELVKPAEQEPSPDADAPARPRVSWLYA
jgi:HK97 family phage prohead protease